MNKRFTLNSEQYFNIKDLIDDKNIKLSLDEIIELRDLLISIVGLPVSEQELPYGGNTPNVKEWVYVGTETGTAKFNPNIYVEKIELTEQQRNRLTTDGVDFNK